MICPICNRGVDRLVWWRELGIEICNDCWEHLEEFYGTVQRLNLARVLKEFRAQGPEGRESARIILDGLRGRGIPVNLNRGKKGKRGKHDPPAAA